MFSFRLPTEFVDEYRTKEVNWGYKDAAGNALGELTFIRTYSRVKDDGGKERWYEVCERVINGMYSIQKDHAKQNRLPWNDNKAQKSAQEAYERLFTLKWTPPGRGLWMMGTPLVHEQKNSAALQNCFTPDTKIVTRSGVATLAELDGQDIEVWAGNDWAAATVQSFGSQNVQRVTFAPTSSRSNVRFVETVTPDHRWELRDGSTTTNLKVGDIVPATAPTSEYDEEGFRHGLIFGDGSVNYRYLNGDFSHVLRLCGDKAVHKELFDVVHYQPNCGGDPVVYHRSTDNMKNLPVGQSQNYVASFIDGWLAADGSTAKGPNPVLASQDAAAIQWLLNNATFAGWVITGHNVSSVVKTNYGNRSAPLQIVTLARPEGRLWTVKSIESLDEPTDVFCAVVPGPERFTLASGIYTSNCSHVSTNDMNKNDPSLPFRFLMEASMLGVGVGYDDVGAKKNFTVYRPASPAATYVIPDTREGWAESTGMLIDSYLKPNQTAFVFDYSVIRPEGAPIKTFGGVAAGPGPLIKLHNRLRKIFDNREGQLLTATDIADIGNLIGACVVSGNVRRSALLFQGSIDDDDFLNLKNPEVFPERNSYDDPDNPGWAYMSNNSVVVDVNTDLSRIVDGIKRNGEPGVIWMDRTRDYGRMIDPPDYRDHRVTGYNPCLTGDAKLLTKQGWITFADAYENRQPNDIVVDGRVSYTDSGDGEEHPENWKISNTGGAVTMQASEVFRTQKDANIVKVSLSNGMSVRLTPDHLVATQRGMVAAEELLPEEDKVLITKGHLPESPLGEPQTQEEIDAVLMGLIAGDGTFGTGKLTEVAVVSLWGKDKFLADKVKGWIQSTYDAHKGDYVSKGDRPFSAYYVTEIADRDVIWIQSSFLAAYLKGKYGFSRDTKHVVPSVYLTEATKKPARLYVAALAFCDGTVNKYNKVGSSSARIAQVNRKMLDDVQLICLANGIASSVYSRRKPGLRKLPDGHGGHAEYLCKESFEIVFMANAYEFSKYIGFLGSHKQDHANEILTPSQKTNAYATVASVEEDGVEDVYCLKEDERRILCANGITMRRCAEQPLESFECCTLAEVHMNRNESKEDFLRTLKFVYLYAKTVTLMPTHWPKTNAIMQRNRRIGTSVSGIANFADSHGLVALKDWFDEGYQTIRRYDKIYSEWLCVRESIRVTTVKPSGTVSILSGESPGVHWTPGGEYFLRRMRLSKKNPIVDLCREAGYVVEPASEDPENTVVIAFPIHSEAKRSDKEVSLYEKANLAVLAQKFWSDNSVSVTLSFDKDNEADAVGNILQMHAGELKTASFLPMGNDTYPQMPFSSYPKSEYEMDKVTLKKIDFSMLYDGEAEAADAEGEKYCSTDACEVQTITINADTEQREVSTPVLNTNLIVFEPHS